MTTKAITVVNSIDNAELEKKVKEMYCEVA